MKKLIVLSFLLLPACMGKDTGLAPAVQIPPIPANLAQERGQLNPNSDITMGGQVKDNTTNIREYNSVAFQVNNLIHLYNCVREAVNNKKEPKCQ